MKVVFELGERDLSAIPQHLITFLYFETVIIKFDLLLHSLKHHFVPLKIACSKIFQVADGMHKTLRKLFPHEIAEIQTDLSTLKINGILDSARLLTFCACGDSFPNLFLYQHTGHKSF